MVAIAPPQYATYANASDPRAFSSGYATGAAIRHQNALLKMQQEDRQRASQARAALATGADSNALLKLGFPEAAAQQQQFETSAMQNRFAASELEQRAQQSLGVIAQHALTVPPEQRRAALKTLIGQYSGMWRALGQDPAKVAANIDIEDDATLDQTLHSLAPPRFQDESLPYGGMIQRNPLTGEARQVVSPQRPMTTQYVPVQLDHDQIGAFDARTGNITPTGQTGTIIRPQHGASPNSDAMKLRKEFRGLQSVKDFETSLPLLVSARKAPDNGYGDLQLIYTVGKVLDPGSVVREGELKLTIAAGSPIQRILGTTRFSLEKGGRLTPEVRQQLLGMLNERVLAYRQAYDRDFGQYGQYAQEMGASPETIIGKHATSAYTRQPDTAKKKGGWSIKPVGP